MLWYWPWGPVPRLLARRRPPRDHFGVRVLIALVLCSGTAVAGKHRVERGETLEHVARLYGCSVDSLLRANQLKTTLVRAGTIVEIPACNVSTHARTRSRSSRVEADLEDRAEQALSVIDGTTVIKASRAEIRLSELESLLTPRELQILRLVAMRLDNQEIADKLSISVGTVKIHLHHVYDKLSLQGRHELQLFLRQKGY